MHGTLDSLLSVKNEIFRFVIIAMKQTRFQKPDFVIFGLTKNCMCLRAASPCLAVIGGDSSSESRGFKSNTMYRMDIFTLIWCKIWCNICLKRPKDAGNGPFNKYMCLVSKGSSRRTKLLEPSAWQEQYRCRLRNASASNFREQLSSQHQLFGLVVCLPQDEFLLLYIHLLGEKLWYFKGCWMQETFVLKIEFD